MTESICTRNKRLVSGLLATCLLLGILLSSIFPVFAFAGTKSQNTVTVTIEKSLGNGNSVHLCGPVQVPCDQGNSITVRNALNAAYAPKTVSEGWIKGEIKVQDETSPDGYLQDAGPSGSARWLVLVDSQNAEGKFTRLGQSVEAGSVLRLVYTTSNGADVGYNGNAMIVKKDALLSLMATINQKDLDTNPALKSAWQQATSAACNTNANQQVVDAAYNRLYAALHPEVPAQSITIQPSSLSLVVGKQATLSATVTPSNTTDKLSWKSLDSKIATVAPDGTVSAVSEGVTFIEATAGNATAQIQATVTPPPVEKVTLNHQTATLTVGEELLLEATVSPSDSSHALHWSTSDPSIATVNGGQVVALKAGVVRITASAGDKQAICTVTVSPRPEETQPTIVFHHEDGRILPVSDSIEFTLLDSGSFEIEGYEGDTYWSFHDGSQSWVSSNGKLYLRGLTDGVKGGVYTSNPEWGGEPIAEFTISVKKCSIQKIQLSVDGQLLSTLVPFQASGSEYYTVTAHALLAQGRMVRIPDNSYILEVDSETNGYASDYDKSFSVNTGKTALFTARMLDDSAQSSFIAVTSVVPVEGLQIEMPEQWQIDGWNGLGGQYSGIQPNITDGCVVKVLPSNASNPALKWEVLTPDIVKYEEQYHNGIVPFKAGTARLKISSVENPSISEEIAIEFTYKYPLEQAIIEATDFRIKKGTVQELPIKTIPENATEQRFIWTYDKEGIVEVTETISSDTSNANNPRFTTHSLYAKKAGTVTVTGTPMDTTASTEPLVFTVTVTEGDINEGGNNFSSETNDGIYHGLQYLVGENATRHQYGDEWTIFSILRSGGTIPQDQQQAYYTSVCEAVKDSSLLPTDRARIVLALLALQKDPTDVGGINLIEQLYSDSNLSNYSSNMSMWTLITLDAGKYDVPSDALWTRELLIANILPYQKSNGRFGLSLSSDMSSVDITAMALQALAPYQQDLAVKAAVRKALSYLKEKMTANAGYLEGGSENSCSAAQVLVALTSMGIDPLLEQNGFTRGERNLITNLMSFKEDEGFRVYSNNNNGVQLMSTQQVTFALESYRRMLEGRNGIFDLTDADTPVPVPPPSSTPEPSPSPIPSASPTPTPSPTTPPESESSSQVDSSSSSSSSAQAPWWPSAPGVIVYLPSSEPTSNSSYQQTVWTSSSVSAVNDVAEVPTSTAEPEQSSSNSQADPVEIPVADETYTIETDPVTVQEHTYSNNRIITYVAIGGIVLVALSGGAWVYWKKGLKHK